VRYPYNVQEYLKLFEFATFDFLKNILNLKNWFISGFSTSELEMITPSKKFSDDNYTTLFIINFGAVITVFLTSIWIFLISKLLVYILGRVTLNYFDLRTPVRVLTLKIYQYIYFSLK
jgi:hypothetical protein